MPCPVRALKLSAGAPSSGAVAPRSHLENARMSASAICCRYSHATSASALAACSALYCAASTNTVNGASRNKWEYSCSNGRSTVAAISVHDPTGSAKITSAPRAASVAAASTNRVNAQQKHAPATSPASKLLLRAAAVSTSPPAWSLVRMATWWPRSRSRPPASISRLVFPAPRKPPTGISHGLKPQSPPARLRAPRSFRLARSGAAPPAPAPGNPASAFRSPRWPSGPPPPP